MKKKLLILLLSVAAVFACAFALSACGGNSGASGTYYLYENGKLDKTQYIKLDGDKWSDDDNVSGKYELSGTNIVFYAEMFGSNEEMFSGTLSDGVLVISVSGANLTYCKEGYEPADNSESSLPNEPATQYTVTYDANGGAFPDGSTTITQKANEGATLTAPNSPTRTAAAFGGWSTNKNGNTLWKFASDTVTGNITLYAVWEEQSAVIISADGATIDEQKMTVFMLVDKNTDSVSLSNKIVCSSDSVWKLYYDKLGQTEIPTKIAASSFGVLTDGDNIFYIVVTSSNGSKVNVYELTVHRSYAVTVSFYNNKNEILNTDTVYTGYEYNVNYTPSISGYTFNYWKNQNGARISSFTPYQVVSLYADCTANTYTATLDVNGGNAVANTTYTVTYDSSFNFNVPTRTGYTFEGWYYGSTQVTDAKGASLEKWTYTSAKTLTAKWSANSYIVTLNVNDANAGTVTGEGGHNYGSNVTIYAVTNAGYTWLGWYDNSDSLVSQNLSYTFKMGLAVTYTAKWIACPVTFNKNLDAAGTVTYSTKTVAGSDYDLTAKTYSGYTWLGWYLGDELLTAELTYTFTMPSSIADAVTYTAKWMVCPVTVQSNNTSAGTIIGMPAATVAGQEVTVTAKNSPGYIFIGWYNGEQKLTDEITYTFNIPSTVTTEQIIYTANWKLNEDLDKFNYTSTTTSLTITGIKDNTVTEITVPEYVTSISFGAFSGCRNLESITIPFVGGDNTATTASAVTLFGYIFGTASYTGSYSAMQYYSSSKYITYQIPSSLKNVKITGGNILYGAFYNCSGLTSITIPDSVTSISERAFYNCSGLTAVYIKDIEAWCNISFYSSLSNPLNYAKNLYLNGELVTELVIPDSVTEIGNYAFGSCGGLTSITIPDSVTEIGSWAFSGCSGLTSITIPDAVTSIGGHAFYNCSGLTSVTIGNSVASIGESAFYNCSGLTAVYITDIEAWCNISFGNDYPNPLCYAKNLYLNGELVTELVIPDSVTSIGKYAFHNCSGLTSVTIPDSVTSIGDYAFSGCSGLTSITIPDSVTEIGSWAFFGCSGLTSITIPDSVTSIGLSAFSSCSGLTSATFKQTNGWKVFYVVNSSKTVISSSDLSNPDTAATYLISTYCAYYEWERS